MQNVPSFNDFLLTLKEGKIEKIIDTIYERPELEIFIGDENSVTIDPTRLIAKNTKVTLALLQEYHQWLSEYLS